MEFKKRHILGIVISIIITIVDVFLFWQDNLFYFILGIAFIIVGLPFVITIVLENEREKENNEMFLEFSRNLVENVRAGTPISKSIINVREKYYGSLTPHVKKLANQISMGIPVKEALEVFSRDVNSSVVKKAITLISEAEKSGGNIEEILESVSESVNQIEKLKKERQAAIYNLVVQGYIIFFVFIVIMLIMQFKILPITSEISGGEQLGEFAIGSFSPQDASKPLVYLLVTQGFFSGLIIGKLSEGNLKAGIKHSFIMVAISILIHTGAGAFF